METKPEEEANEVSNKSITTSSSSSEDSDSSSKRDRSKKNSLNKSKREKSLEGMKNLEHFHSIFSKHFPSLMTPEPIRSSALKNNYFDFSPTTPKKIDDFKNIKMLTMKGYYSDTARADRRKSITKR